MTRDEADRIDRLIESVADWRVDTKQDLLDAVTAHQNDCLEKHLKPLTDSVNLLLADASQRQRDMKRLKYLMTCVLTLLTGAVVPLLIHYF